MKKVKLTPPDKQQCQAMILTGCHPDAEHFMNIGPGKTKRCDAKPTVIAYENQPAPDGQKGSMSLCDACLVRFEKAYPSKGFATIEPIKKTKYGVWNATTKVWVTDEDGNRIEIPDKLDAGIVAKQIFNPRKRKLVAKEI